MREMESLHELRETNNSLLTTKQNETMKVFTILAFVTLPLSLIASIFEMNTRYTPIIGLPFDFWIIIGGMAVMSIAMFSFFKFKKWF
jgi:magnesium transporter